MRRSPPKSIATSRDAPRLACVRPVASVHPEPGSNSSLYYFFLYLRVFSFRLCAFYALFLGLDVDFSSRTTLSIVSCSMISSLSVPFSGPKRVTNLIAFPGFSKFYESFFSFLAVPPKSECKCNAYLYSSPNFFQTFFESF